jgi:hypothetical protein
VRVRFKVGWESSGADDAHLGPKASLMGLFSGWHHPIAELIAETEEHAIRRYGLHDREPLDGAWGKSRVDHELREGYCGPLGYLFPE